MAITLDQIRKAISEVDKDGSGSINSAVERRDFNKYLIETLGVKGEKSNGAWRITDEQFTGAFDAENLRAGATSLEYKNWLGDFNADQFAAKLGIKVEENRAATSQAAPEAPAKAKAETKKVDEEKPAQNTPSGLSEASMKAASPDGNFNYQTFATALYKSSIIFSDLSLELKADSCQADTNCPASYFANIVQGLGTENVSKAFNNLPMDHVSRKFDATKASLRETLNFFLSLAPNATRASNGDYTAQFEDIKSVFVTGRLENPKAPGNSNVNEGKL